MPEMWHSDTSIGSTLVAKQSTRLEALADDLRRDRDRLARETGYSNHTDAIGLGLVDIARAITEIAIEFAKDREMVKFSGSDHEKST
jgi:hypothetical protein